MKWLGAIVLSFVAAAALADDINIKRDLETLGEDEAIIQRAKNLAGKNRVDIVQNRLVNRNRRFEIGATFGWVGGGDVYINTLNFGANVDYHINPHWSVGVRYARAANSLNHEGQRVFNQANAVRATGNLNYVIPEIDYPSDSGLVTVSWYPIYGKLNLFDRAISQFDMYGQAGLGRVTLSSGPTETAALGIGVGIWFTQHFATRLELRYQTYSDLVYTGRRHLDLSVTTLSMGYLL